MFKAALRNRPPTPLPTVPRLIVAATPDSPQIFVNCVPSICCADVARRPLPSRMYQLCSAEPAGPCVTVPPPPPPPDETSGLPMTPRGAPAASMSWTFSMPGPCALMRIR